jgi:uncharacterized protein (DUF58 family)
VTSRFWFLLLVIFILIFAGMGLLQGEILILSLPLLAYLAFSILGLPSGANIQVERSLSARVVSQNAIVDVEVHLDNAGEGIDEMMVYDEIPEPLERLEGENRWIGMLSPQERISLKYLIRSQRGKYFFRSIRVIARDHFGLLQKELELRAPGDFQALPELPKLKNIKILPSQTRGFFGPIPSRQRGSGMIFWGVREFHIGDPLRQVNWKVSSHSNENLFTNEFEMERLADVGLILDARRQTNLVVNHETLFEYSVLATAALADAFLAEGHRVSMLIYGYGLERVFPGYGKIQRERILQALAGAEPGSNYALENFNFLPTRLFPAKSQLIVISPVDPRDYGAYVRLRRNGYEVMLVSPNPVEFETRNFENTDMFIRALRLARIERNHWLRRLARLGIQVVDWSVDQPFDAAIYSALGRQPVYRRNPKMILP